MSDQADLSVMLETAIHAAKQGGDVLRRYWGKLAGYREKSTRGDLVTEADQASEDVVLGLIREAYPRHAIVAEESGAHEGVSSPYLWAVDPLDGTTNYAHTYPQVAVSIGVLQEGEPVVAVVYNPIIDELFTAAKGGGAYLNGEPIHVSPVDRVSSSLLATGFAYDRRDTDDNNYEEFCELTSNCHGVRRDGAAAIDLAYVAAGRFDGFWERGLKIWDVAAGALLVNEAGGKVTGYHNEPVDLNSGWILATNGRIHTELHDQLQAVRAAKSDC